jgi:hypothetical protein
VNRGAGVRFPKRTANRLRVELISLLRWLATELAEILLVSLNVGSLHLLGNAQSFRPAAAGCFGWGEFLETEVMRNLSDGARGLGRWIDKSLKVFLCTQAGGLLQDQRSAGGRRFM